MEEVKDRPDTGGRELYYVDANGKKQDKELWDEILGADDQNIIQLEDLAGEESLDESAPSSAVSKLEKLRSLFRRAPVSR